MVLLSFSCLAGSPKIFLVVNKKNKVDKISKATLQKYFFKNERKWADGSAIKFFDRKEGELRRLFLENFMGKSQEEMAQLWKSKRDAGELSHTQVEGDEMTVMLVAYFPGGIGYVSEKFAGDSRVKVLKIED